MNADDYARMMFDYTKFVTTLHNKSNAPSFEHFAMVHTIENAHKDLKYGAGGRKKRARRNAKLRD